VRANTREPISSPAQWPDIRNSGGIFFDACSHDYDLVRWLCRSEVSRVEADGAARSQPDQHTVITNLYLANEVVAQVDGSRVSSYGYDVRAEVIGTRGAIFMSPDAASDLRILKGPQENLAVYAGHADRFREAYRLEMESFISSIVKDEDTKATAQDGKQAVEIAAAARKAMQEGKAVNLPL
jgi:scyllo-inositol 2-dehydrogenase (NAD+)